MHKCSRNTVTRTKWRFFGKSLRLFGRNYGGESNRLFQYIVADDDVRNDQDDNDDDDGDWRTSTHINSNWTGHLEFYGGLDDDRVETISRTCELPNGCADGLKMESTDRRSPSDVPGETRSYHDATSTSPPSSTGTARCQWNRPIRKTSKAARNRLIASCVICLAFMIAEVVGGYYANSLAIMTDAAHLLSDFTSFLISLFALWLGSKAPTKTMSYGYHRAEVVGAAISVLLIWSLTGVLIYSAVKRVIAVDYAIDSDIMLLVSSIGIAINIVMAIVLHGACDSHGHSHTHGGHSHASDNINIRAAFVHVLGDFVQSIGVLLAAVVIKFKPEYKLADPICTFVFSGLVVMTTVNIARDTVQVLMEGFPRHLDYVSLEKVLKGVHGIRSVHDLHVWSLTTDKNALVVHVVIDDGIDFQAVLHQAENALKKNKYEFHHVTIQVEKHSAVVVDNCR